MNKRRKILIIACIFMAAGILLAAIGFFTGASRTVVLGSHGITIVGGSNEPIKSQNGLKLEAFTSVDGQIGDSDIHFVPSDHFGMDFTYSDEADKPKATVSNGVLKITQQSETGSNWCSINLNAGNRHSSHFITVYHPTGIHLEKFSLQEDSGNIDASDFSTAATNLSCASGNVTLKDASCGKCTIQMENGDGAFTSVRANTLKYQNKCGSSDFDTTQVSGSGTSIGSSNGSIRMQTCTMPDLTLSDGYGSVSLTSLKTGRLQAQLKDGQLQSSNCTVSKAQVENSCGSVKMTGLSLTSGGEIRCKDGSISLDGLLEGKTVLYSDCGSVSVKTSLPQSKYRCNCSTECGSVTVNGKKYGKDVFMPISADNSLDITAKDGSIAADFQS